MENNDSYKESKRLLLDDLYSLKNNKETSIYWDNISYTPLELIKEIEEETEIGKEHINMHSQAMKKILEIKNHQVTNKKWWQIWR